MYIILAILLSNLSHIQKLCTWRHKPHDTHTSAAMSGKSKWHACTYCTSTATGQKLTRTSVCNKQWEEAVALLAVWIDTKGSGIHFYCFPEKAERRAWVIKTGHWTSTLGSVAFILCLEPRATIPYHPIMYHQCYTKNPVKRKLASNTEKYERKVEAKEKKSRKQWQAGSY